MGIKKYKSSVRDQQILEAAKAREIVHEILNFGVSQNQILTVIKLLSLELEDINMMKSITKIIEDDLSEDISQTTTILT